tara:strand:+ start:2318 stop:3874 length:1557 start_codon:yes stop_codon:yes gene_type:complete
MNNKILIKENIKIILLCLFPAAVIAGPLVAEIIIVIVSVLFILDIFKNKKFKLIDNKIFYYLIIFYLYLVFLSFFSEIPEKILVKTLFYFRFIIFAFAIFEIIKSNKNSLKYIYLSLSLTIFIVVADGYFQLFFDQNLLGVKKYRVDRISGFFFEDLILGSFLSKIFLIHLALVFYFKNNLKKIFLPNIILFLLTYLLIFLSGERAAFAISSMMILIIFIMIDYSFKIKAIVAVSISIFLSLSLINNPTMNDRYFSQLNSHLFGFDNDSKEKEFELLPNYMPMFKTALNMFKSKPIIGYGPKSYRQYCDKEEFVSFYSKISYTNNFKIYLPNLGKKYSDLIIEKFLVTEEDILSKGQDILIGRDIDNNLRTIKSDKSGKIRTIYNKKRVFEYEELIYLENPNNLPENNIQKFNACTTHPHNIYIQLLAETGIIGFLFPFIIFLILSFILIKNLFFVFLDDSKKINNFELCIIVCIFGNLWPIITSGNFFNNWINFLYYYPLGFYLLNLHLKKKNEIKS